MENEEYPIAKFLRLTNGDDIIAETIEMEDDKGIFYMLHNPLKVVYMQLQNPGYLSVSFIPWVFPRICDNQEFTIHASDVLLMSNVSEKMNEYYWDNLDTLIQRIDETPSEPQQEQEDQEEKILDMLKELTETKRTFH